MSDSERVGDALAEMGAAVLIATVVLIAVPLFLALGVGLLAFRGIDRGMALVERCLPGNAE